MKKHFLGVVLAAAVLTASCGQEKVRLFDGKTLDGWIAVLDTAAATAQEATFSVRDGALRVSGQPFGYIRTEKKYTDYTLHVEWRWIGKGTNSGIFQRVQAGDKVWPSAYECQLHAGDAGDVVSLGGARIAEIPYDPNVKFPKKVRNHHGAAIELPEGEWNRAEIICKGNKMMIYINGSYENLVTTEATSGYIALQSEGGPLAFRNIYIE